MVEPKPPTGPEKKNGRYPLEEGGGYGQWENGVLKARFFDDGGSELLINGIVTLKTGADNSKRYFDLQGTLQRHTDPLGKEIPIKASEPEEKPEPAIVIVDTPKQTEPELLKLGIPLFITNKLKEDLKSFGVSESEIDKLKPEEAWNLLLEKKWEKQKAIETKPAAPTIVHRTENPEGWVEIRTLSDGTIKVYNKEGKVIRHQDKDFKEIPLDPNEPILIETKKIFKYVATDKIGQETKGTLEVYDENEALGRVKEMGLSPISIIEKITDAPEEPKPGFWKKNISELKSKVKENVIPIGVAAGIAVGGGVGYFGQKAIVKDGEQKKTPTKNEAQKKDAGTKAPVYVSTTNNYSADIENLKKRDAQTQADLKEAKEREKKAQEKLDEINKKLAAMEKNAATPAVPQKPVKMTTEEKVQKIQEKIDRGEGITGDEQNIYNRNAPRIMAEAAKREREAQQVNIPKPEEIRGSAWVTPYGATRNENLGFNPAPKQMEQEKIHLSEKAQDIIDANLEKIFPTDLLTNWRNIKDRNAHEFMAKPESKVKGSEKSLYNFLKKIKETTNVKPANGIRGEADSIEKYIDRAFASAEQKDKTEHTDILGELE